MSFFKNRCHSKASKTVILRHFFKSLWPFGIFEHWIAPILILKGSKNHNWCWLFYQLDYLIFLSKLLRNWNYQNLKSYQREDLFKEDLYKERIFIRIFLRFIISNKKQFHLLHLHMPLPSATPICIRHWNMSVSYINSLIFCCCFSLSAFIL